MLAASIIKTLAYFDVFSYPLTERELFRYLWQPPQNTTRGTVAEVVQKLAAAGTVHKKDGFVFLAGDTLNSRRRHEAVRTVYHKLKIAQKAARRLRWIPWVRAMFVTNSTAAGVARDESDVDLLIVAARDRLWLARFCVILTLVLFRMRVAPASRKDKICLCFYVTEDALSLKDVATSNADIYLAYWIVHLVPIYDPHHLHKKFQEANEWVRGFLPHAYRNYECTRRLLVTKDGHFVPRVSSNQCISWLDRLAQLWQLSVLQKKYGTPVYRHTPELVISDSRLKFHDQNEARARYKQAWQERWRLFFLP